MIKLKRKDLRKNIILDISISLNQTSCLRQTRLIFSGTLNNIISVTKISHVMLQIGSVIVTTFSFYTLNNYAKILVVKTLNNYS